MGFWANTGKFLFGDKGGREDVYDPQQMQLLQQLMSHGGPESQPTFRGGQDYINSIYNNEPGAFDAFEAPYKQNFQEQILPALAERFAAGGSNGNLNSSSYRNALTREGSQFQTGLAALREQLKSSLLPQALDYARAPGQDLNSRAQTALQRSSFQNREGSQGIGPDLLAAIGASVGGPALAAVGKGTGDLISKWFQSKSSSGLSEGNSSSAAYAGRQFDSDRDLNYGL